MAEQMFVALAWGIFGALPVLLSAFFGVADAKRFSSFVLLAMLIIFSQLAFGVACFTAGGSYR